ncbi:MAG: hypothetical protein IKD04_09115 [Clostridia bacterium]|nr:hypothetical protein [Clostridia bacterium]
MGFLDKMKDVGKGALKGALIMSARSYANVTRGKHKLCKISLNTTHDKLMFIKVSTIEEECVIKDSIRTFSITPINDKETSFTLKLFYKDGETSDALIMINENKGSALSTASERVAAQYSDMADFIEALAKNVSELDESMKEFSNKIMRYAGKQNIF